MLTLHSREKKIIITNRFKLVLYVLMLFFFECGGGAPVEIHEFHTI